jgi:hypothetical protein
MALKVLTGQVDGLAGEQRLLALAAFSAACQSLGGQAVDAIAVRADEM